MIFFQNANQAAKKCFLSAVSLSLLSASVFAQAQSAAADLRGTVTDPNGAVVANAAVTVRSNATSITRTTTTDEEGIFQFLSLPPGTYQLEVEAASFKKAVNPSLTLTVGQSAETTVVLEVGQVSDTVTVSGASAELVETARTSVATTIDQQRIENLPINQRDYLGFTLTTSSVGRDNGRPVGPAPTSGLNFGGQRGRSNLVQVDGVDNTDNSINAARATVSQEAVQEFQVVTNSFAPEFGRSAGGVVNVVTKRGTNDFTGNVFGFIRDRSIQARYPFAPEDKPAFRRYQYGATLGGPIARDHTYFFAAVERRQRDESGFFTSNVAQNLTATFNLPAITGLNPAARSFNYLTAEQVTRLNANLNTGLQLLGNSTTAQQGAAIVCAVRAYAFFASSGSNTGLSGVNPLVSPNDGSACPAITAITPGVIGSRFLLSGAPVPLNTTDSQGRLIAFRALNNLQRVFPITDRTTFYSVRLDHTIDANNQLTGRIGYTPSALTGLQVESQNQSLGQNDYSRTGIQRLKDTTATVNLISTYGNFVNEGKFSFGKRKAFFGSQVNDAVAFNIADTAFIGRELFSPVDRREDRFILADNVTVATGNHTLKFGADFNWVNIPATFELNFAGLFNFGNFSAANLNPAFATLPTSLPDFTPVQSYGLGLPTNYIQGFGDPRSNVKNKPIAFFAQDSWRIHPRVTVNYGVRYDVEFTNQIAPVGFRDPLTGINLTESDILAAQNAVNVQQGIPVDKDNIAPRLAVAWDVFGNGSTVIRGAGGMFYDHPLLAVAFNSDIADAAQQQQAVLLPGSPAPNALLNATQVFQGTVCGAAFANPLCPAGLQTPGLAASSQYQYGRQRFNDQTFTGFGPVLPFTLPMARDFEYAYATQANAAIEQRIGRDMALSVSYLFVGAKHLPRPTDLNQPQTELQIQNFQRFAGRDPRNPTEAIANISIATTAPGTTFTNPFGVTCGVVIPGIIAQCPTGRVISPAVANFFRPNAPNYFLAQTVSGGLVTKAVLDSQLAGTLRTPGLITPFGSVNAQVSDGNSTYNALTVDFKRRFANNFQFLTSYTWAHSIDDSSDLHTLLIPQDPRNRQLDRATSLFDQRHRFVFSGLVASPTSWRSGNGFERILADFTIAPIVEISSGRPFNILTSVDTNNDQSSSTDRPNVRLDGTLCVPGQEPDCGTAIITDSQGRRIFAYGNLGRNMGITRGYASVDMRVTRAIRFGERARLDLIAEGFNLFNRFNQSAASPFYQSVNAVGKRLDDGRYYGRATATYDQRQFQFGLKLNF